jgi:excinuclease ABC subunit A
MNKSPTGTALRRFRKRSTPAATTERPTVPAPKEGPIELHGVATHNLKHIDAIFPFQRWTAVTGPSGSGKSSLVFDTLFAESRRLYLESLSFFVRARMDQGLRAECDDARGLTPPIAISPRASGHHPRSTVGTLTEIYDYYRLLYSRAGAIPDGLEHTVLTSAHFSFNHERGACPRCTGLGILAVGDPEALVTDPGISLLKGALDGTKTGRFYGHPQGQFIAALKAAGAEAGVDFGLPFALLNESAKRLALEGSGERLYDIVWAYQRGRREGNFRFQGPWKGFLGLLNEEYERKHADHRGESMRFLMKDESCPDCGGKRIRPEALRSKFLGLDIAEFSALSVEETLRLFADEAAFSALSPVRRAAVSAIRPEITRRLSLLRDVGLDYLTIDRRSATLSGGEAQRLRLAALLGARLTGLTYILDEPTLGLHPRDIENLIGLLRGLVQERNTMIVVDNDFEMISAADRVLDLGPGAGEDGGRIEAQGPPAAIAAEARSATGRALAAARDRPAPWPSTSGSAIRIRGGRANNLQAVDVEIPGGAMTVVTGVSGSGKTSLVFDILGRSAEKGKAVACDSIEGLENFSGRTIVGQDPPARSPLSTVATFTGIIDPLRNAFASSPEAKVRGFGKSHFSYLTPQGRCETCGGEGVLRISLDFLADVETVCEDCRGARFKPSVLAVRWRGLTIADILRTSAAAAAELLGDHRTSRRSLETLVEVGLGYLELGRTLDTLSGGEAQRMKLAAALAAPVAGPVLHLFDEPTAGLHPVDIEKILGVFRRLVREGHTLVVVEHDLDIIARARHIIDLGPAGGNRGGRVVAAGPLEAIASSPESATGAALLKRYGPTAKRPAKDRQ